MLKKLANLSVAVKASISFFIATLITKGISFIATPIFTRLLSTEVFGQVSVYYSWMQLFGIIAMFCLSYGVFNVGLLDYPNKRDEFSFSMLILSNIITICFAGIIFCLYPFVKDYLHLSISMLVLMIVFFLFQPAYLFWLARQKYEYKYKWPFFWSSFAAILSIVVPVLLIVLSKNEANNLYYRIFGAEVALIVVYIGFYVFLAVKSKFKVNPSYWKFVLLFNLPLIPHYLSAFILSSSDKIMISYLISDEATAYYTVAYQIATIALILWSAIDASFMPYTFQKLKGNDYESIKRISIPILSIFAIGCFIVIMLGPEIVRLLSTEGYEQAANVIPPVVGGVFFQIQYFLYSNVLYFYKKPRYVMIGSVVAASLNIALNYFCIKRFGYIAAAFTTLGCYFIQAFIDYFAMRKVSKHNIYNMKFVVCLSLVVTLVSVFGSFLYKETYARYAIILMFLFLPLVFWKKICGVFVEMKKAKKNG